MNKMKTLTVNGKTYEICDPSAPRIDNTAVGDSLWSSQRIVAEISKVDDSAAIVNAASGEVISTTDASNRSLQGLTLYGKTTQDGTPAPDAPVPLVSVGDSGSVELTVAGKNLLENINGSGSHNGINYTVNEDGSITCTGTSTASNSFQNVNVKGSTVCAVPPGDYIVSGGKDGVRVQALVDGAEAATSSNNSEVAFTVPKTATNSWIRLSVAYAGTTVNTTVYPMVRLASVTDATYEPYKGQTLTFSTPNGLPGKPVASGGNYTDENGQQWVCDEIDFARGVYVQRVYTEEINNPMLSGVIGSTVRFYQPTKYAIQVFDCLCNCLPCVVDYELDTEHIYAHPTVACIYAFINTSRLSSVDAAGIKAYLANNPIKVMYVLAIPIETPLTAEELTKYAALHTKCPNTTVLNDAGAGMALSYVADTKTYIDNKFNELAVALVNNA